MTSSKDHAKTALVPVTAHLFWKSVARIGTSRFKHSILFFLIALICGFLDLYTKDLAEQKVKGRRLVAVVPTVFGFRYTTNEGIIFGLLRDLPRPVYALSAVAIPIIIIIFISIKKYTTTLTISIGLILGGTIGNVTDRLMHHAVRDFIDFYVISWPIFNLADSFILMGSMLLMLEVMILEEEKRLKKTSIQVSSHNPSEIDLSVDINKLRLKNPVLVASGTFGGVFDKVIDVNKLGGVVLKTITLEQRKGNEPPRVVETAYGIINSIGLENKGLEGFIKDELPYYAGFQTRLIVSVAGKTPDEFAIIVNRLNESSRIDAIELNISCPNVSGGLDFGTKPSLTEEVVSKVKRVSRFPIIAKLTPNVTDICEIARSAINAGADALSLINTVKAIAIDWREAKPVLGGITGGLSGPAIKPIALRLVWEVCSAFPNTPVIAVGGIATCQDVLEFICAGATAVQIGTANFMDPSSCIKIVDELPDCLKSAGLKSVRELIGKIAVKFTP